MEEGPGLWGEDVVALRQAEMWVVGWTGCVTLGWETDSQVVSWERLGVGDMALVLWQSKLCWCGYVLQGDDGGWVGGCVECEVEGPGLWGREVVGEDYRARGLNAGVLWIVVDG